MTRARSRVHGRVWVDANDLIDKWPIKLQVGGGTHAYGGNEKIYAWNDLWTGGLTCGQGASRPNPLAAPTSTTVLMP